MPIPVACSNCGAQGRVPDQAAGTLVRCKKCGQQISVMRRVAADPFDFNDSMPMPGGIRSTPPPIPQVRPTSTGEVTGALALAIGLLCLSGGVVAVVFFAMIYDTSVEIYTGDRIHNVGKMQNRLIGLIIGLCCSAVGLVGAIVGGVLLAFKKPAS